MIRVLCLITPLLLASVAAAEVILTPAEIQKTLRHGPWPTEQTPDPSNRASGNPAAIALGAQLFFDPTLSNALQDGRWVHSNQRYLSSPTLCRSKERRRPLHQLSFSNNLTCIFSKDLEPQLPITQAD